MLSVLHLYRIGDTSTNYHQSRFGGRITPSDVIYLYRPSTDEWCDTHIRLPLPLSNFSAVYHEPYLYIIGMLPCH
jgi:hypothetical protein